jgi:hypothetical protein
MKQTILICDTTCFCHFILPCFAWSATLFFKLVLVFSVFLCMILSSRDGYALLFPSLSVIGQSLLFGTPHPYVNFAY